MSSQNFGVDLFENASKIAFENNLSSLRKTQDPYAYYNIFGDPEDAHPPVVSESIAPVARRCQVDTMSKKDFQNACRRIFLQYIPPAEGQTLRAHYRGFIVRNERRSPEERARLAEALSQYDLSASGNFKPHFNRGEELLTTAKLQQLEKSALKPGAFK